MVLHLGMLSMFKKLSNTLRFGLQHFQELGFTEFRPNLQLAFLGPRLQPEGKPIVSLSELMQGIWNMAVPKSKVKYFFKPWLYVSKNWHFF